MSSFGAKFWQSSNVNSTTINSLHTKHSRTFVVLNSNTSDKITRRRWRRIFEINCLRSTKIFILPIISFITLLIALVILLLCVSCRLNNNFLQIIIKIW